jgi:hypothetical protein
VSSDSNGRGASDDLITTVLAEHPFWSFEQVAAETNRRRAEGAPPVSAMRVAWILDQRASG